MTFPAYEQIAKDLGIDARFRQVGTHGPVPSSPNMIMWTLDGLPGIDTTVDRVARWFQQWPEAIAHEARANVTEISIGTFVPFEDVKAAIEKLVEVGYIILRQLEDDGSFWFLLPLVPPHLRNQPNYGERPERLSPEGVPPEQKRAISLRLRWAVLARDGHRCKGCGASAADGAVLHIDHIKPFSKGGLTVLDNLQALCRECNAGKFDKWAEP